MSEIKTRPSFGSKVWIRSIKKTGMVVRVEWDKQYGPQYLVSVYDTETIEDTYPYTQCWFKNKDVESTAPISSPKPRINTP